MSAQNERGAKERGAEKDRVTVKDGDSHSGQGRDVRDEITPGPDR